MRRLAWIYSVLGLSISPDHEELQFALAFLFSSDVVGFNLMLSTVVTTFFNIYYFITTANVYTTWSYDWSFTEQGTITSSRVLNTCPHLQNDPSESPQQGLLLYRMVESALDPAAYQPIIGLGWIPLQVDEISRRSIPTYHEIAVYIADLNIPRTSHVRICTSTPLHYVLRSRLLDCHVDAGGMSGGFPEHHRQNMLCSSGRCPAGIIPGPVVALYQMNM